MCANEGSKSKKVVRISSDTGTVARYLYVVASQLCARARFPRAQQAQVSARTRGHLTCGKLQKQIHVSAQIRPSVEARSRAAARKPTPPPVDCRLFLHRNMHGVTEIHPKYWTGRSGSLFYSEQFSDSLGLRAFGVSLNAAVVRRQVLRWTEDSSKNHSRI